jgi:hypothetical protein
MMKRTLYLSVNHLLVFILLSYAVTLSIFIDEGLRNYLVLFAAGLGGVMLLAFRIPLSRQFFLALLLFAAMALRSLWLDAGSNIASVALTFLYGLGLLAIVAMLDRVGDKRELIQSVLRWLIYAYAAVSVIQMVFSLSGLPVPNQIASKGLWSYNSLAFEPSQLGRVVGISMLCYLILVRLPVPPGVAAESPRSSLKVLIAFLVTMFLSGSTTAAVAIFAVYLFSRSIGWAVIIVVASFLVWPLLLVTDFDSIKRAVLLISSLRFLDVEQVLQAEHSGGLRVAPLLVYIRDSSMAEAGFWFGYGQNGLDRFFYGMIKGLGDKIAAGFLPGFTVVYGAILMAAFIWLFTIRQLNRTTAPLISFWLVFFVNSAWNTQVFWYGLIVIQVAWAVSRDNARRLREVSA